MTWEVPPRPASLHFQCVRPSRHKLRGIFADVDAHSSRTKENIARALASSEGTTAHPVALAVSTRSPALSLALTPCSAAAAAAAARCPRGRGPGRVSSATQRMGAHPGDVEGAGGGGGPACFMSAFVPPVALGPSTETSAAAPCALTACSAAAAHCPRGNGPGRVWSATQQGLTLVPISAQLEITWTLSAQLKLTVSPI